MKYKFNDVKQNYALFASGSILYSLPGQPAFPIRLSSEIFQRCAEILRDKRLDFPYRVYDPFCGSGYLITSLGFFHGNQISNLVASDISKTAVELARRNLNLLTETGLDRREQELDELYKTFQKESHLESIEKIKQIRTEFVTPQTEKIFKRVFQANALSKDSIERSLPASSIDIVISDLPYGSQTKWFLKDESSKMKTDPIVDFLETITYFVKSEGLIVLVTRDKIKFSESQNYIKIKHFKIGRRHIYIFRIF